MNLADRCSLSEGSERTWRGFKCYCDPELINYRVLRTSSNRLSTKANLNGRLVPGAGSSTWEKKTKLMVHVINTHHDPAAPGSPHAAKHPCGWPRMKSCIRLTAVSKAGGSYLSTVRVQSPSTPPGNKKKKKRNGCSPALKGRKSIISSSHTSPVSKFIFPYYEILIALISICFHTSIHHSHIPSNLFSARQASSKWHEQLTQIPAAPPQHQLTGRWICRHV